MSEFMNNFSLAEERYIRGVGTVRLYDHKNGGRAVCIDSSDDNCVFSLCFSTPPLDDTGIPHILEHCVLCGSENFPVKDPFGMLVNSTSHTYLNAITFPHKTLFPVASLDRASLRLMAEVYCDAVFYPLVCRNKGIFLQEGGFFDGEKIRGVVHSEMSGFYDVPEKAAEMQLIKAFTPRHAAGVPSEIPRAEYKALLEYHKKYYTPANCLAYICGSCDKSEYLELLDSCFSKCGGERVYTFDDRLEYRLIYKDISVDTKIAVFPLCPASDYIKVMAFEIIVSALKNSLPRYKVQFNADGNTVYAVVTGADRAEVENAVRSLEVGQRDIDRLRFYIAREDFGFKPKGLFLNLKLMYADGDLNSIDFGHIFEETERIDLKALACSAFIGRGIYGKYCPDNREKPKYKKTDPSPFFEYQTMEMGGVKPWIPLAEYSPEAVEINGRTAFVPCENKDIIYITLAFELDMPSELLRQAGVLLQNYRTGLDDLSIDFIDLGEPCAVIHAGFFTKNAAAAAAELNSIFGAGYTGYELHIAEQPEKYTDLLALSGIEKNARILSDSAGLGYEHESPDIRAVQRAVFAGNKMAAAVCCHIDNCKIAMNVLDGLSLYGDSPCGNTDFAVCDTGRIMPTEAAVNTISLALRPDGSRAAAFMAAEVLKNIYLWENVRNKGAYGCSGYITPGGSLCINSFKDPNLDETIETFKRCGDFLQKVKETDMHRFKVLCLNTLDRPKSYAQRNVYALKKIFGCEDIRSGIISLKAEDIRGVFTDKYIIAAFRAKK